MYRNNSYKVIETHLFSAAFFKFEISLAENYILELRQVGGEGLALSRLDDTTFQYVVVILHSSYPKSRFLVLILSSFMCSLGYTYRFFCVHLLPHHSAKYNRMLFIIHPLFASSGYQVRYHPLHLYVFSEVRHTLLSSACSLYLVLSEYSFGVIIRIITKDLPS